MESALIIGRKIGILEDTSQLSLEGDLQCVTVTTRFWWIVCGAVSGDTQNAVAVAVKVMVTATKGDETKCLLTN